MSEMSSETQLSPCVRCGAGATIEDDGVICVTCGMWTGEGFENLEDAIKWWNYQPLVNRLHARITELEQQLADAQLAMQQPEPA